MPIVKRAISPVEVSRNRIPPNIKTNELQCVANGTLANLVRQLSSLSKHAEDIFGELVMEAMKIEHKVGHLNSRLDRLSANVAQLDSNGDEVTLQELHLRKPFKSSSPIDQQSLSRHTLAAGLSELYAKCEPAPDLDKLTPYRDDNKSALKFYTDPDYFFDLWAQQMQAEADAGNFKKPRSSSKTRLQGEKKRGNKQLRPVTNQNLKYVQKALSTGEHIEKLPPEYAANQQYAQQQQQQYASLLQQQQNAQAVYPPSLHRPGSLDLSQQGSLNGSSSGYGSLGGGGPPNGTLVLDASQQNTYGSISYAAQIARHRQSISNAHYAPPQANYNQQQQNIYANNLNANYGAANSVARIGTIPAVNNSSIGQYMPGLYSMQSQNHNNSSIANSMLGGYNNGGSINSATPVSSRSQTLTPDEHQQMSSPSDSVDSRSAFYRSATANANANASSAVPGRFRPTQPPPAPPPGANASLSQSTLSSKSSIVNPYFNVSGNPNSKQATSYHNGGEEMEDSLPPPPPALADLPASSSVNEALSGYDVTHRQFEQMTISSGSNGSILPPPPDSFLMSDSFVGSSQPHSNGLLGQQQRPCASPELPPPPLPLAATEIAIGVGGGAQNRSGQFAAMHGGSFSPPQKKTNSKSPSPPKGSPIKKPGAPPPPPPPPPGIAPKPPSAMDLRNGDARSSTIKPARPAVVPDARTDLLKAIRQGIQLKKVEEKNENANGNGGSVHGHDVAAILARRVVMAQSESESDDENSGNEWDD